MNTLKTFIIVHKLKILILLPVFALAIGVCFVQIPDRTKIKRKFKIEYLIIHYTANFNPRATARMNATYLRNKRQAGTHYCVDDQEIVQCTPEHMVAYSVGDRIWRGFTPKPWLMSNGRRKVLNHNSLSFEMCLGGNRNDSLIIDKTAQMIGWQLVNKGLDISRVIRHHDVTGKHCPKFAYNENWNQIKEDSSFNEFKKKVEFYQNIHLEIKRKNKLKSAKIVQ